MPPLKRPETTEHLMLPPRQATVAAEADVLVVGGGPAGLGAAVGAATAGARVVLAERYGYLGGNATAALITLLVSYHTATPISPQDRERLGPLTFLPTDHGPGEPAIGGVLASLVGRLVRAGGALRPSIETGFTVPFDPEAFKLAAMDLLDEAGVDVLLHAFASDILDRNRGAVFETKSGPVVVRAGTVIDCTGDGDMAVAAGAGAEVGREEDGLVQPMSLLFRLQEFDREAFGRYVRGHPDQWRSVHGLWDLLRQAAERGELDLPREDVLMFATPHERELLFNSTRITRAFGTDVWDLTRAEWQGRLQMRALAEFLKRRVPGFERSYVLQSGACVGVREARRIVGEYRLTGDDVLSARRFEDVIARGTYPLDLHNPAGRGTVLKRLPSGEAYDIPLRCLLPRGVDNLLVAGRCISGTHEAHSSYRVMPISMATGQAAGVCAALAAAMGRQPRDIPARDVQAELVRQGAILGPGAARR